eukprot:jgi/Tetstr1/448334/TSEL_035618.t1
MAAHGAASLTRDRLFKPATYRRKEGAQGRGRMGARARRGARVAACSMLLVLAALSAWPPGATATGERARSRIAEARASSQRLRTRSRSRGSTRPRSSAFPSTASVSQLLRGSSRRVGTAPRPSSTLQVPEALPHSACEPYEQRELPMFKVPRMKCPRFADWSPIAAVGADLAKPGAILAGDTKQRKLMEIILLQTVEKAPTPQERAKLLDKFPGANHFLIYATKPMTAEEALNRLVAMASASAVVLVEPGQEADVTPELLAAAKALLGRHERMGMLGFGAGWRDGVTVRAGDRGKGRGVTGGVAFVDALLSGPVVVKRDAFLEVGGLWAQCPGEPCLSVSYAELSLRMWEGGRRVALAGVPGQPGNKAGRRLLEVDGNNTTDSISKLQPHWLKKLASGDWGGLMQPGKGSGLAEDPLDKLARLRAEANRREGARGREEKSAEEPEEPLPAASKPQKKKKASGSKEAKEAKVATETKATKEAAVEEPPETRPPKTFEEEAAVTAVEDRATGRCADALRTRLAELRPTSRLAKCMAARASAAGDLYGDTVDAEDGGARRRAGANLAALSMGLEQRSMTPSDAIPVCGAVSAQTVEDHKCPAERAQAALILQYFKRPQNIELLAGGIANTTMGITTELLINDDSRSDVAEWLDALRRVGYPGRVFLALSNNIHEIRGYNRLSKFTTAHNLAHLQDDDVPASADWLHHALVLLKNQPKLAVLGGLRGRMDYGTIMDTRYNYINGPKYGVPSKARGCCKKIVHWDKASKIPFMFMYKVNLSPLIMPRRYFMQMGMYHLHFSCAGQPGIGLDFEISVRAWKMGLQAGLYDAKFKLQVGQSRATGTRSSAKLFALRRSNELRNNKMMYTMYKGFHHKSGMSRASAALNKLPAPKGYEPMNDAGGTANFLRQHRGWYLSNKVSRSRSSRQNFQDFVRSVARRAKGT